MDERSQFTFYRSFWEAVQTLPKKDKLPILEAIIKYALDGEQTAGLTMAQNAFFLLVKPTLDASRKKAISGKQGGSKSKQTESKTEANNKQTESKKEKEKEKEKEYKCNSECAFDLFWESYPKKVGYEDAKTEFDKVSVPVETLLSAIELQKKSIQWQKNSGEFIPNPSTWLIGKRWNDQLATTERTFDHDETAAIIKMMGGDTV